MLNQPWNIPDTGFLTKCRVSPSTTFISRPLLVGVMSATDTLLSLHNKQCQTEAHCHGDLSWCVCVDIVVSTSIGKTFFLCKTYLVMILTLIIWRQAAFPALYTTFCKCTSSKCDTRWAITGKIKFIFLQEPHMIYLICMCLVQMNFFINALRPLYPALNAHMLKTSSCLRLRSFCSSLCSMKVINDCFLSHGSFLH